MIGYLVSAQLGIIRVQGLTYLCYPLLGHLADVYLTRYRALKSGLAFLNSSLLYFTVCIFADTIVKNVSKYHHHYDLQRKFVWSSTPGFCFIIIGTGLFEANAIQFGLDQLLEAPTTKLIAFIHWYYWAQKCWTIDHRLHYVTSIGITLFELSISHKIMIAVTSNISIVDHYYTL